MENTYSIWLTTKCNLRCKYCYEHLKPGFCMNKEILETSLRFIDRHNKETGADKCAIQLHGGEPLLEFDLIKYYFEIIKSGFFDIPVNTYLTTNGILLIKDDDVQKKMIEFLAENIDDLSISIDGNAYSHDLNRMDYNNKGTYESLKKVIPYILEKQPECRARMTVAANVVNKLAENILSIAKLGFKRIAVMPDYYDESWNEEKCNNYYEQAVEIVKMKRNILKDIEVSVGETLKYRKKNAVCSGGKGSITIYANGDIYPCVYSVGVKEECIGSIYTGLQQEKVEAIQMESTVPIKECEGCTHYDYCPSTRCKIVNKRLTGQYETPCSIICAFEGIEHRLLLEQRKHLI